MNFISKHIKILGILFVIILLVGSFLASRKQQTPVIPEANNGSFVPPQSEKIIVQEPSHGQTVNNFYKNSISTAQTGTTILSENSEYQLVYNNENKTFIITLLPFSQENTRAEAENALIEKLGVTLEEICSMNVNVYDYSKTSLSQDPVISTLNRCRK